MQRRPDGNSRIFNPRQCPRRHLPIGGWSRVKFGVPQGAGWSAEAMESFGSWVPLELCWSQRCSSLPEREAFAEAAAEALTGAELLQGERSHLGTGPAWARAGSTSSQRLLLLSNTGRSPSSGGEISSIPGASAQCPRDSAGARVTESPWGAISACPRPAAAELPRKLCRLLTQPVSEAAALPGNIHAPWGTGRLLQWHWSRECGAVGIPDPS